MLTAVIAMMLRWYARHQFATDDPFPLLAALVLFLVAAALSVVTFAGIATLVWQSGLAASATGADEPAYRLAEQSYGWNLVDSVPLLAIPDRLGWADPLPLTGTAPGAVLLGYKLILLLPLISVAQTAYAAGKRTWLRAFQRRQRSAELINEDLYQWTDWTGTPPLLPHRRRPAPAVAGLVGTSPARRAAHYLFRLTGTGQLAIAGLAVAAVIGSSQASRLLDLLPDGPQGPQGPPGQDAAVAASTLLSLLVAIWLGHRWIRVIPARGEDLVGIPLRSLLLVCAAWIVQVTCAAAAMVVVLLGTGAATMTPAPADADRGWATLEALAWQATAALPGPDIPATLQWAQPRTVTGVAAAAVEIALLISLVLLLAFPIGRAFWDWSRRTAEQWRDPLADHRPVR